jgi:hypothetical protein
MARSGRNGMSALMSASELERRMASPTVIVQMVDLTKVVNIAHGT